MDYQHSELRPWEAYLFVYGSLRPGLANNYLMSEYRHVGRAKTVKPFTMYPAADYRFPYLFENSRGKIITGDIYAVPAEIISDVFDVFEGVDIGLYRRISTQVDLIDVGESIMADIYVAGNNISESFYDVLFPLYEWTADDEANGKKMAEYIEKKSSISFS